MAIPNPYIIHIELYWQDGTRPNQNQVARVNAFEANNAWRGQSGYNPSTGGWQDVVIQNNPPVVNLLDLKFQVVSTSEQQLHMTKVFQDVPGGSTVKIIIGLSDELIPPGGGGTILFTVTGKVTDHTGAIVTVGSVQVCDVTNGHTAILGSSTVNSTGIYSVTFPKAAFQNNGGTSHDLPNLVAKYYDTEGSLLKEASPTGPVGQNTLIDIVLPEPASTADRMVFGDITNTLDLPVSGVVVEAFHLSWTTSGIVEIFLGHALSDGRGAYEIHYAAPSGGATPAPCAGELSATGVNLLLYAKTGTLEEPDEELARTNPYCDAPARLQVDIEVDAVSVTVGSEYTRIDEKVAPCLGADPAAQKAFLIQLDQRSEYLTLIAKSTELPEDLLRAYVRARLIAIEINEAIDWSTLPPFDDFDPEVIYALVRSGKGSTLDQLLSVEPTEFYGVLVDAINHHIVQVALGDRLSPDAASPVQAQWAEVLAFFLGTGQGEDGPLWQTELMAVVVNKYAYMSGSVTEDEAEQIALEKRSEIAKRSYDFVGPFEDFVDTLVPDVLDETLAESLLFVFEVYELVDQYLPIVKTLYDNKSSQDWHVAADLATVPLDGSSGSDWLTYAANHVGYNAGKFPGDVPGKTSEEKARAYAQRLYDIFGDAEPEVRFVGEAENDAASSGDAVLGAAADFIKDNPEFDLASTPIDKYIEDEGLTVDQAVVDRLKQLQRVNRLTPKYEVATALIEAGYGSAVSVSLVTEADFVVRLEPAIGLTDALAVHRKAKHYASEVYSALLRAYQKVVDNETMAVVPAATSLQDLPESVIGSDKFPNWVTLFGALNSCASRHCQTVLSPGAYLTDLLRFIEDGPQNRLLSRRPDLADIEVTCENTDRVLPYIDLVIEVLENVLSPRRIPQTSGAAGPFTTASLEGAVDVTDPNNADRRQVMDTMAAAGYLLTERAVVKHSVLHQPATTMQWVIEDDSWRFRLSKATSAPDTSIVAFGSEQTSKTATDLDVFPEHYNEGAATVLASAIYPLHLPLELGREEQELLLSQRGSNRSEMIFHFRGGRDPALPEPANGTLYADPSLAREHLELTAREANAVLLSGASVANFWGFSGSGNETIPRPESPKILVTGQWYELLAEMSIFMNRSQLKYAQVLELLDTEFVHASTSPRIGIAASTEDQLNCNYYRFQLTNLTEGGQSLRLGLINHILRLRRLLGWTIRDIDRYLMVLEGGSVPSALTVLSQFQRLTQSWRLEVREGMCLLADLDLRRTGRNPRSQFDEFYKKGASSTPEFSAIEQLGQSTLTSVPITGWGTGEQLTSVDGFKNHIRAALGLKAPDMDILWDLVVSPSLTDLSVAHLSAMARVAVLSKAQRISVEQYRSLFNTSAGDGLFGISAFADSTSVQARISSLFDAAEQIARLKNSGASIAQLDYVLRHFDLEGRSLAPSAGTDAELHGLLTTAGQSILERYPDREVPGRDALAQVLGEVMPAERVPRILDVLSRPPGAAPSDEEGYFRRYLTFALGAQIDAVLQDLLVDTTLDEEARLGSLWVSLRPELVRRARATAAVDVATAITGASRDRVDRLLNQMLTSLADTAVPAISDWIFGLSGWNTGDDAIDRTSVSAATTWESGWLVPSSGHVQPVVALASVDPSLQGTVTLSIDGGPAQTPVVEVYDEQTFLLYPQLPDTAAGTVVRIQVSYGGPHPISIMAKKDNDDPRVLGTGALSPFFMPAHLKLYQAELLSNALGLARDELVYLSDRFDILDELPLDTTTPIAWSTFTPFLDALSVNRAVSLDETNLVRQWLEEPYWPVGQTWTDERAAQLSGWKSADLALLRGALWTSPPSYSDPWTWQVLAQCMRLLRTTALSAQQVLTLIVEGLPTPGSAAILRDALRSNYSDDNWSKAFKPLRDQLRQRHRDALVGVLTDGTSRQGRPQFVDANDMYAHFLIDSQMEPDVQLSRIKLALNVVQLFVQRVFMGLEGESALYELERKKDQWSWMRNYRVWEANRKVFLWPENWIEPELRDDKTDLFKTLEDQLLQDEVTDERARELLVQYAEGMEEVAKLLVIGACFESVFAAGVTKVLHVVARTRSAPYTYYHRTFDGAQFHDGAFSPWKKIPLEIDADSVAPAVVNGALHIAWPLAVEKGKVAKEDEEDAVDPLVEVRFIWSKLSPVSGKWSKPKASKEKIIDYEPVNLYHRGAQDDRPITKYYHFRTAGETDGTVRFELIKTNDPTPIFPQFDAEAYRDALRDSFFYLLFGGALVPLFEQLARQAFDEKVRQRNEQNAYIMPQRLGIFSVDGDGTESATVEKYNLTLSSNIPRHVTLISNAAESFGPWEVDGELPQNRYGFRNRETLLNRVYQTHRTVATNLGFFGTSLDEPFFFETSRLGLFGLHRETRRVPGLSGVVKQGVHFTTFNHPVMDDIMTALRAKGPAGIMERLVQALPTADYRYYYNYSNNYLSTTAGSYVSGYSNKYSYYGSLYLGYRIAGDYMARGVAQREFEVEYRPTSAVQPWYPWPTVSFEYGTSMGIYNWELFFHVPLMIADRLSQQMRFEDAMKWYHFVFDPRQDLNTYEKSKSWAYALPPGARYWNFLPFFANDEVDETLLDVFGVTKGLTVEEREDLRKLIDAWRKNPFNPHLIARQRISAYQKATVMKYLDNLIAWADQLFRQDTFESINEATQLYVLAAEILGDRPEVIEPVTTEPRYTYRELAAQTLTDFSNVLVEVESLLVGNAESVAGKEVDRSNPQLEVIQGMSLQSLYFSIPRNTKLDGYWDTVADRLFKIRNSMNIDGIKRTLALFEPPIDPALLVKAAAAGIDLSTVIAQLNRPQPHYRFRVWMQKSVDLVSEVKSFGGALLSALEKKDGEELSLLRQGHEIRLLKLTSKVREEQVKEAEENIEALLGTRAMAVDRFEEYTGREYKNDKENTSLKLAETARSLDITAGVMNTIAGTLGAIPQVAAGAFSATAEFGGQHLNAIFTAIAAAINTASGAVRSDSAQASTLGGYDRRQEDWDLQADQAELEIAQIDKQIAAAEIRAEIARKELANQEVQIEQSEEVQTFLQEKFTNKELYQWMAKELTRTYRQAYTLAYDVAKTAERTFRYELGLADSDFIQFGYMDGPQGLLAGEKLGHDLRRMDIAYLEQDKREFELTKQISLATLNPYQLQTLRETGSCEFSIPEVAFDLDFPGQYFRRIQAVRVTIPCVTGPYTTVSAKLSLLTSAIRVEATAQPGDYSYKGFEDPRFSHSVGGIQSIATSSAQDDAGLFELNFNDERYLPFEGSGAISRWRLELPEVARQFDYHTISDVILGMSYTARDAGGSLKQGANEALANALNHLLELVANGTADTGMVRVFSMKREFPNELHRLLTSPDRTATLTLRPEHFHYLLRQQRYELRPFQPEVDWTLITKAAPTAAPTLQLALGTAAPTDPGTFTLVEGIQDNVRATNVVRSATIPYVEEWQPEQWQLTQTNLTPDVVDDLLVTIRYVVPTT